MTGLQVSNVAVGRAGLPPVAITVRLERMTVPDDGWHEVPEMVMLTVGKLSGWLPVAEMTGAAPITGRQDGRHKRKERP